MRGRGEREGRRDGGKEGWKEEGKGGRTDGRKEGGKGKAKKYWKNTTIKGRKIKCGVNLSMKGEVNEGRKSTSRNNTLIEKKKKL